MDPALRGFLHADPGVRGAMWLTVERLMFRGGGDDHRERAAKLNDDFITEKKTANQCCTGNGGCLWASGASFLVAHFIDFRTCALEGNHQEAGSSWRPSLRGWPCKGAFQSRSRSAHCALIVWGLKNHSVSPFWESCSNPRPGEHRMDCVTSLLVFLSLFFPPRPPLGSAPRSRCCRSRLAACRRARAGSAKAFSRTLMCRAPEPRRRRMHV